MVSWFLFGIAAVLLIINSSSPEFFSDIADTVGRAITSPQSMLSDARNKIGDDITLPLWLLLLLLIAVAMR